MAANPALPAMNWEKCVGLALASAASSAQRRYWSRLIASRRVDAGIRDGKRRRAFCLTPSRKTGPYVALFPERSGIDALTLAHELQHAWDQSRELSVTPDAIMADEISARRAESRLIVVVKAEYGGRIASALFRKRFALEVARPLRTLVAQIAVAEALIGSIPVDPPASAIDVPLLYPLAHILSWTEAFRHGPFEHNSLMAGIEPLLVMKRRPRTSAQVETKV